LDSIKSIPSDRGTQGMSKDGDRGWLLFKQLVFVDYSMNLLTNVSDQLLVCFVVQKVRTIKYVGVEKLAKTGKGR
jgi:hypothetical protein